MSQYYVGNSRYLQDIAFTVLSVTILEFIFVVIALIIQRKCLKKGLTLKEENDAVDASLLENVEL